MYSNEPVEFTVDVKGEKTGESYPGVFKARPRLSHLDTLKMDQLRRDLLGPKPELASPDAQNVASAFSKIWAHLVGPGPRWWQESGQGINLVDEDPVAAVYSNILRIEKEAQDAVVKKGEEARAELKKSAAKE
jgi:hypothetical protein